MSATALAAPAAPAPAQTDWDDMLKKKGRQQPEFSNVNDDSELSELAKSFTKKFRRNIVRKTAELIKRRNEIDSQLLQEDLRQKPSASDWRPREKLLRRHARLAEREERHIRRQKRKLARAEMLYKQTYSKDRAIDYDLIHYLLWRFKRHLGPLMKYHRKIDGGISSSSADSDSEWIDVSEERSEASGPGNREGSKHSKVAGMKRKRNETSKDSAWSKCLKTSATNKEGAGATRTKDKKDSKSSKKKEKKKRDKEGRANMEKADDT
ncbi:hypothetical protein DL762_002311 [Monosporascus cannonballus]|uniref:rRNA-processing protein EFG1 n=1 Tax=Monosporascus cannonballus TaxID=155416 RepID=A0ABY0HE13_9PEZI|nr:hypothetical protein DL762_002311 [Monosporascus cannonballus]